jgi:subtilase family serine protease
MSWGIADNYSTRSLIQYCNKALVDGYNKNCINVASSGDTFAIPCFPSTSNSVVSVGGTTLTLRSDNTKNTETAWNATGYGTSSAIAVPSWQKAIKPTATRRFSPDISLTADPKMGLAIPCKNYENSAQWYIVGGTSLSAPLYAGMMGCVLQARVQNKKSVLNMQKLQTALYNLCTRNNISKYNTCINDIAGRVVSNGRTFSVGTGIDNITGVGTPKFAGLCSYLININ